MRAKLAILGAVWTAMALGACHLVLGIEEKSVDPNANAGSGGMTNSASGQGGATSGKGGSTPTSSTSSNGGATSSSSSSQSAGGSTNNTTSGAGGTGGSMSAGQGVGGSVSGGTGGTSGAGGASTDSCGTCTGLDVSNQTCAEQFAGNKNTGMGWKFYDPKCKNDPNYSAHCFSSQSTQKNCTACRMCFPDDPSNTGPGCTINDGGGNAVLPDSSNQGRQYCPPCVCQTANVALNRCPGSYDHCL